MVGGRGSGAQAPEFVLLLEVRLEAVDLPKLHRRVALGAARGAELRHLMDGMGAR